MKVLITGFDPFGGEKINPAYEAVKRLPDEIENSEIIKIEIPTVFKKSYQKLEENIKIHNPDIVICIGQAGGRFEITPERVAINIDDARIKDNEGNQPIDQKIFEDGDSAYFSTLPIKAMVKEIKLQNIPASISNTAGTFVCNHIMYSLLYLINKKYPNIKGGFIHVPFINEQIIDKRNTPYMNLNDIIIGLTSAVKAAIKYKDDIKTIGGKLH
ncbi:pyroglutamyl-peptidase I [Oceanotoga sp. DSM 15011]|uniref:Pyrrolidone-carboxylate peptidase n=1 Tax=Oceanotoga teriensis TaxID=515440 RepID=A0AA45C715_9BACT|nr:MULTISPECIES: pyroglutamyl-peptidase I [Oceanotoga]MDO7975902.1 pyroglutamyl-peptidase I [Oceanotoga teriensis]PWJ95119.1 pyroglutamyl-peptidase [Oceanotoga teriensis]UYO99111.1 pyroglutamyl-peptidase I [Oceanotoga sp. DSM 15011]